MLCYIRVLQSTPTDQCLTIPHICKDAETLFRFVWLFLLPLHGVVGKREFIKALHTTDKHIAVPKALRLAATAKQLFSELTNSMTKPDKLRQPFHKGKLVSENENDSDEGEGLTINYEMALDLDEFGFLKGLKVKAEPHEQEAVNSAIKTTLDHDQNKRAVMDSMSQGRANSISAIEIAPQAFKAASVPLFEIIINGFLKSYQQNKNPEMFKKHKQVLPMLLEITGTKPINELKQADINGFFVLLEKLPPRWSDECRMRKLTIKKLAELEYSKTLGPKSFEDTYKASVRSFLKTAKKDWQDQRFPTTLTTEGIEYQGNREEGEGKQRAFTQKELERLLKGSEMAGFAVNPEQAHYFWLPHIGFFTGARVNEICQLNPQTDILKDSETDIWYFWITEETDGDERISKRTKNKVSRRKVPVHSKSCFGELTC